MELAFLCLSFKKIVKLLEVRSIFSIIFITCSICTFCQTELPVLKKQGSAINQLIPHDWKILASTNGDLNKDHQDDLVFVIQNTDQKKLHRNEDGLGRDTVDLNPRIMAIYFKDSTSGLFMKHIQCNDFIILSDSPTMDEPFEGIEITQKGTLKIKFNFWYNAGSWFTSNHTYIFRYQNNEFTLIGYSSMETHRGTGEIEEYSVNFSTKKMSISTGTISDDKPTNVTWKSFKLDQLKTLKTLSKPFEWKFEGINL